MKYKNPLLLWFPVILLPAVNIVVAIAGDAEYSIHSVLTWILGAAAEELFFRFFLLKKILMETTERKPAFAILLVSILFAGMHLFNLRIGQPVDVTLVQMFGAFCFSIWAGAVTWKSTWLIPLLAHVLMNATAGEEVLWVSLAVSAAVLADGLFLMRGERI